VSLATLNEPDGEHKRIAVKVVGTNMDALQQALLTHADWELVDSREAGESSPVRVIGK